MNKILTTPEYISQLNFDYIETYSFCRGAAFEANLTHPVLSRLLWSSSGTLEPSAQKKNTFPHHHPRSLQLISILQIPAININYWMCAPFYRDAIVFYDHNGQVLSTLNVCLSCDNMQLNPTTMIDADNETYKLLRAYFIEIGHEIEDPGIPKPFPNNQRRK
jgi:hypothetical protein